MVPHLPSFPTPLLDRPSGEAALENLPLCIASIVARPRSISVLGNKTIIQRVPLELGGGVLTNSKVAKNRLRRDPQEYSALQRFTLFRAAPTAVWY